MHECIEQNLWNFDGLKLFKSYIHRCIAYIYTYYVQSCSDFYKFILEKTTRLFSLIKLLNY